MLLQEPAAQTYRPMAGIIRPGVGPADFGLGIVIEEAFKGGQVGMEDLGIVESGQPIGSWDVVGDGVEMNIYRDIVLGRDVSKQEQERVVGRNAFIGMVLPVKRKVMDGHFSETSGPLPQNLLSFLLELPPQALTGAGLCPSLCSITFRDSPPARKAKRVEFKRSAVINASVIAGGGLRWRHGDHFADARLVHYGQGGAKVPEHGPGGERDQPHVKEWQEHHREGNDRQPSAVERPCLRPAIAPLNASRGEPGSTGSNGFG